MPKSFVAPFLGSLGGPISAAIENYVLFENIISASCPDYPVKSVLSGFSGCYSAADGGSFWHPDVHCHGCQSYGGQGCLGGSSPRTL